MLSRSAVQTKCTVLQPVLPKWPIKCFRGITANATVDHYDIYKFILNEISSIGSHPCRTVRKKSALKTQLKDSATRP